VDLKRRDFLKLAGVLGAGFVITAYSADIKRVFAQVQAQTVHLVWLQLAGDSGCSISMLQAYNPDLVSSVVDLGVSVDFWSPFMTPDYELGNLGWINAGYVTEDTSQVPLFNAAFGDAPVDVLVVEGSPQVGTPPGGVPGGYCMVGQMNGQGVTGYDLLQKLAAKATYVVSVGQCSSFGGIPAGKGNLTGATSVTNALQMAGVTTMNTVVNMPGCPAHPDWTLVTLASVLQGFAPDLDGMGRPTAFYSETIHDRCPRRGAYDKGDFAAVFDDPTGCLWELGCKGPITYGACSLTHWNSGTGTCTLAGPMCWGCMHPSFPDPPTSPFFQEIELVPAFFGINVNDIAIGAAVATVGIIGVHAVTKKFRDRGKKEEDDEGKPEPVEKSAPN
jgi:hydrogenase small subunit